jgi:hypothetical protein
VYHRFLVNNLLVLLEHAPHHQWQQCVVHAWRDTVSFSPHCHTAPEPDFRWAVDRTLRPNQLAFMISWTQASGFLAVGTPKDSSVEQGFRGIQQREKNSCQEIRMKLGIFDRVRTSVGRKLKVVLKCMGTTQSTCCRDLTNTDSISQALVSGICWLGYFGSFKWVL